ncbi:hypothetical protein BS47DRAFT_441197 [Hydnum rufescens UP504]|uniref:Uncharacterized protein n=1 Tax=Hydnum rufescens UP504 TaxID=1448309 RepID=A0A9P6B5H0_9AGAM|nr:hypothetical protein BS47DRAFT_441197 [Hydnum rufescens UP504]
MSVVSRKEVGLVGSRKDIVDWDAIVSRPPVYDDDNLAFHYAPSLHGVDPLAVWTFREEKTVVWKTDLRVMLWMIASSASNLESVLTITYRFLALDLDRGNISQAIQPPSQRFKAHDG